MPDNSGYVLFGGDLDAVPTHCLTQRLATIMSARHVVLVATGSADTKVVFGASADLVVLDAQLARAVPCQFSTAADSDGEASLPSVLANCQPRAVICRSGSKSP